VISGADAGVNKASNPAISNYSQEFPVKTNEGGIDRILRIVAGLVLLGLTLTGNIGVWGWIGVVLLATGALGWCPLYSVLGLNTCPMKSKA
jgi:hypothetical protein